MSDDWHEVNLSWGPFCDTDVFSKQAKPGMEIEVRDQDGHVSYWLIGDVNIRGGFCDCCREIEHDDLVVRWRWWSH